VPIPRSIAVFAFAAALAAPAARAEQPRLFDPDKPPGMIGFRPGAADELYLLKAGDEAPELLVLRSANGRVHASVAKLSGRVGAIAFLDRDRLVAGDTAGGLFLVSADGRRIGEFAPKGPPVAGLGVSPSRGLVAVRYERGPIRLFTADGRPHGVPLDLERRDRPADDPHCEGHFGTFEIAFSPDSKLIAAADVCAELVLADSTGRFLARYASETRGYTRRIAFSGDGGTILSSWWGMPGGGADLLTVRGGRFAKRRKAGDFGHRQPEDIAALPGGGGFVMAVENALRFVAADGRRRRGDVAVAAPAQIAVAEDGARIAVLGAAGLALFDAQGRRIAAFSP
jgi:hypothetical protein